MKFSAGINSYTGATSILDISTSGMAFNQFESVVVTFLGSTVSDISHTGNYPPFHIAITTPGNNQRTLAANYSYNMRTITFTADPIPEPSAALLGLLGTAGLVVRRRR